MSNRNGRQFTLQYLNDAGDIITRDYFDSIDKAKQMAQSLLDTYKEYGSENVRGLCIEDENGLKVVFYDIPGSDERSALDAVIRSCEKMSKSDLETSRLQNTVDKDR